MTDCTVRTLIPGLRAAALLLALSFVPGCSEFNLRDKWSQLTGETGEFRRPMRVVAIWSDTVLTNPATVPIRGFGARLMFYEGDKDAPIKVSGTLTVYAFDEAGRAKTDARPDRKYVFTADQLEKHYSKSELGHSYSVWVPWDPVGGESKEISLIVRFVPAAGGVVISEQVKQFLPGTMPAAAGNGRYAANAGGPPNSQNVRVAPVQLVQHQQIVENQDGRFAEQQQPPTTGEPQRMTTTTIAIPFGHGGRTPTALLRPRPTLPSQPGFADQWQMQNRSADAATATSLPQQGAAAGQAGSLPAGAPTTASLAQRSPTPAGKSWITHYAQKRSRALGEPIAPLLRDRGPLRPSPAIRPSAPATGSLPLMPPGLGPSAAPNPQ
ncbi:MAG TPA: hypothetical protein VMV10_31780 [Pirellulales bacterium]|nr:hypothetical protein [Pirellulales bacterium]